MLLRVLSGPRPPIGSFDVPADGTEVTGEMRLSGWALHEIGLAGVSICRDHVARSAPSDACGGDLTPIGEAELHYNDRPDVAAAVGPQPYRQRSGWTYVLDPRAFEKGALGTARFYAVARGIDGTRQVIGVRRLTIEPAQDSWFAFSPRTWRILALLVCRPRLSHSVALVLRRADPGHRRRSQPRRLRSRAWSSPRSAPSSWCRSR